MTDSEKLDLILNKVTEIELHIENVTDKNIQTVAEGHLDLSRKCLTFYTPSYPTS